MTEDNYSLLPSKITSIEMGIAFALAIITSICNLTVIIAVYKDPYRELRTISNFLVVNLAAADLIVGIIVEPLWALQYWVTANRSYSISVSMLLVLSVDASCLTVLFLTIERYIALERPLRQGTFFNIVATKIYICLIWITALVISCLVIPCWNLQAYNLFLFTGIGCFLMMIMLCLYIRMFMIIRKFNRAVLAQGVQQRLVQPDEASLEARKREQELAKAIFLFVGIFALCWLPAVVTETVKYSEPNMHISEHIFRAVLFLGLFNSALNPIIYTFRMPSFRRAMARVFVFRSADMVHELAV